MNFIFISGRSTNQGRYINIGKDTDEYRKMVSTLRMNSSDLAQLGLSAGMQVNVRSEWGEVQFRCEPDDLFCIIGVCKISVLSLKSSVK